MGPLIAPTNRRFLHHQLVSQLHYRKEPDPLGRTLLSGSVTYRTRTDYASLRFAYPA